ncbi:Aminotransferase-like, plant mobile domain [Sesbania bispinosa]|nr:Aminotransferase-like, plant mobile domain [Sesbania bispinosa]
MEEIGSLSLGFLSGQGCPDLLLIKDGQECPDRWTDKVVRRNDHKLFRTTLFVWVTDDRVRKDVRTLLSGGQCIDEPTPTEEVPQQVVYEGGPQDPSLLRSYESHVARHLWSGEVITHGRKLKRPENDYVRDIVDDSGLGLLVEGTHSLVDKSLLSTFVERWHKDTSSFHLPVGEMTITLDDVNTLLHMPVHGRFFFLPSLGKDEAKELLVTLLGVSYSDAHEEIEYTRGPSVRLSWLRTVYENSLSYATRAYLLHLVGCTIFTDKSASNVRVQYLEMFRVLAAVGHIAWGAVALAYLYEQLNEASLHQTRQLAGYSTLFQAWILEQFPHVTHGERSPDYVEGMPLSRRLRPHHPVGDVVNVRQYLDRIRHSDIIWTPRGPPVTHAGECTQGYLDWFRQVSHPYLIPRDDRVHDPLPRRVTTVGGSQDIPSGTPEDSSHQFLFAGITERLQALLSTDMCVPGSDGEMLTHEMLRMDQLGQ